MRSRTFVLAEACSTPPFSTALRGSRWRASPRMSGRTNLRLLCCARDLIGVKWIGVIRGEKGRLTSFSSPCSPFWSAPDTNQRTAVPSTHKCSCVQRNRAWTRRCKSTGRGRGCLLGMASHRAASGRKSPYSSFGYNSGGSFRSCCSCGCIGRSALLLTRRLPGGFRNRDQLGREMSQNVSLTLFALPGSQTVDENR